MPAPPLAGISLCVLVSGGPDADGFERLVTSLFETGVRMVQIRDKELADAVLIARVQAAMAIGRRTVPQSPPVVIVNDRVQVARSAGADGVHLGATDMPVVEARLLLGDDAIIGRTTHALDEAHRGIAAGADYLGVGPCFPSKTKAFSSHASRDFLAQAARLPIPVFAIGGITAERLDELRSLGIKRIAVAAAVTAAADPAWSARQFLQALAG